MKSNKVEFFNETIYHEKLDCGIDVYILKNKDKEDAYVTLTTKYGGYNKPFLCDGKYITVPNGIAHFLEHKVFEQKEGIDPFSFYGKTGTYCNATTNYYNTTYVFAGNKNFNENLNYLLDFVYEPYFTDENVLKEKGIIIQELKMYEDVPDRKIYEKILYNLFNTCPIKYSIGGSIEDVKSITKNDLYNVYNTFYNPSNMFLVITGNVDENECMNIIKENIKNKKFKNVEIKTKDIKEDDKVFKQIDHIKSNVSIPYVAYGIKIPLKPLNKIDAKKRNLYITTLFDILFDETSIFYEEAKGEGILDIPIYTESIDTPSHKVIILLFKSNKYKDVLNKIESTLNNIKIDESDLERKKKVHISNILYSLDDISSANKIITNNIVLYNKIHYDIYKIIKSMNIDELNGIIKLLNLKNHSTVLITSLDS